MNYTDTTATVIYIGDDAGINYTDMRMLQAQLLAAESLYQRVYFELTAQETYILHAYISTCEHLVNELLQLEWLQAVSLQRELTTFVPRDYATLSRQLQMKQLAIQITLRERLSTELVNAMRPR